MNIINASSNDENNKNEIRIIYNNPFKNDPSTKIFGEKFVEKNSEKCKIKVNDKLFN